MTNTKNNPPQAATDLAGGVNGYTPSYPQHATDQLLFILLNRIAGWLLDYAYGDFSKAVSAHAQALADMMALVVYASAIAPVPMSFDALGEDLPARRMLDAAALLIPGCHVRMCPVPRPSAHTDISTDVTDELTAQIAELPLLPALAVSDRGTAATLRRGLLCVSISALLSALLVSVSVAGRFLGVDLSAIEGIMLVTAIALIVVSALLFSAENTQALHALKIAIAATIPPDESEDERSRSSDHSA